VSNQTVAQAQRTLHADGLVTRAQPDPTANAIPRTQVIRTRPVAGTAVHKGQTVVLVTGNQGPPVPVPNLVGNSVSSATTQLKQAGFQVNVQTNDTCTQQLIVCDQNPKSGTAPPGSTVNLITAPNTAAVPDVTGLDEATACNNLGHAGFLCGTITRQASQLNQGSVISTSPSAGSQQPPGTVVNLVVSSGPSSVVVPDVVGETQGQAVSALQGVQLQPVVICESTFDPTQNGVVQSQNPAGGKPTTPGATVNITVGCLSAVTTTTPTTTTPTGHSNSGKANTGNS
jgi:serine/threonine-protein kinase